MPEDATIRYLTRAEVVRAAEGIDPVAVVRAALAWHANGRTTLPAEAYLPWNTSTGAFARSLALPAAVWGERAVLGLKLINSSLDNPGRGLPRAQGLTMIFDRETAYPVAIMEAAYLSSLRTAAYSTLSVQLLGPPGPAKVAVLGCGAVGAAHIRLFAERLSGVWFGLYDQSPDRRDGLVESLCAEGLDTRAAGSAEDAVRDSDIVLLTTTTTTGYVPYEWLSPGALVAHVSLDDVLPDVVHRADLVVIDDWQLVSTDDRRLFGRMYREGHLLGPKGEAFGPIHEYARRVDATLADIVAGHHPGRRAATDIVLSNPFGMGVLDVAIAAEVLDAARARGLGTTLDV
jgi:N-[(2S)-2-amino-2-carboxyethyl]-L-glutamate dehydrogenase